MSSKMRTVTPIHEYSWGSSKTQPSQAALLLDTMHQHQCVGENTVHLATVSVCTAPGPPQESLLRDGTRTSLSAKPSPSPDDAGPIVRRPMGLPVVAGCDRAWTEPGSLVAQLALRCSSLDHCTTWEAHTIQSLVRFSTIYEHIAIKGQVICHTHEPISRWLRLKKPKLYKS